MGYSGYLDLARLAAFTIAFAVLFVIFLTKSIKRGNRITELERLIKERDPELYKEIHPEIPFTDQQTIRPQGNVYQQPHQAPVQQPVQPAVQQPVQQVYQMLICGSHLTLVGGWLLSGLLVSLLLWTSSVSPTLPTTTEQRALSVLLLKVVASCL